MPIPAVEIIPIPPSLATAELNPYIHSFNQDVFLPKVIYTSSP
jgi:hypothetical protein